MELFSVLEPTIFILSVLGNTQCLFTFSEQILQEKEAPLSLKLDGQYLFILSSSKPLEFTVSQNPLLFLSSFSFFVGNHNLLQSKIGLWNATVKHINRGGWSIDLICILIKKLYGSLLPSLGFYYHPHNIFKSICCGFQKEKLDCFGGLNKKEWVCNYKDKKLLLLLHIN